MSSKSRRIRDPRISKAAEVERSWKTKKWPNEVIKTVRDKFVEMYLEGPVTNENADYAVPVLWTKTGVTMWKAFVEAVGGGKEAAAATAILTGYLQNIRFAELCKNTEVQVINEIASNSKGIGEMAANFELSKIRNVLVEKGMLMGEGIKTDQVIVDDLPQETEEGNGDR